MKVKRVLYLAGPGDVINTWRLWKAGQDDPRETSVTFSGQFFDTCRRLDLKSLSVAWNGHPDADGDQQIRIEHMPKAAGGSGLRYHWTQLVYAARITWAAMRWRPDVAVVSSGATHWFMLLALVLMRIRIIAAFHNRIWSEEVPHSHLQRLVHRLNGWFLRHWCCAAMVASADVGRQLHQMTGQTRIPLLEFLPVYRERLFGQPTPPPSTTDPLHLLFIGRIERSKGVFDLLEACRRMHLQGRRVTCDFCGDGTALAELKQQIEQAGLGDIITCHGHCDQFQIRQRLAASHLLVLPSTAEVGEGFPMVIAEAVLAQRPAVVTRVCPCELVQNAVRIVEPSDVEALTNTISRLQDRPDEYATLCRSARDLRRQFLDIRNGWGAALEQALRAIEQDARPATRLFETPRPRVAAG